MASVPWLMYFAARNFFFADHSKNLIAAAAILGTIYWWNSLPREMFFYGMIGFPVASYLSVWGVSLFYRIAKHPTTSLRCISPGSLLVGDSAAPCAKSVMIFVPPVIASILHSNAANCPSARGSHRRGSAFRLRSIQRGSSRAQPSYRRCFSGNRRSTTAVRQHQSVYFYSRLSRAAGFLDVSLVVFEKGFRLALLVLGVIGIGR